MADLGTDVSTFPDMDATGRTISGTRALAECSLRRLTTPEGSLEYDTEFGYDLRDLVNEDLDARDLRRHQTRAEMQLELDERIRSASVTLTLNTATSTLMVRVSGTLVTGSDFAFVLAIDKVSSTVLTS